MEGTPADSETQAPTQGTDPGIYPTSPVAEIAGAPSGETDQANPEIVVGGRGIVAYRFKLDGGEYSEEIPVDVPIRFSADITMCDRTFTAGSAAIGDFLDNREGFIEGVGFSRVEVDTSVVFLLNPMRASLLDVNRLYIGGKNIDQLDVRLNSTPDVPATVEALSIADGSGYIIYGLEPDSPDTDWIRIVNKSGRTASFSMNLNSMLFPSDEDVLDEIHDLPCDFPGEPLARKTWRFIRGNRSHWHPLSGRSWISSSPALFFNSIGFGYCDDAAILFCQLMTSAGYKTREWRLTGHVVSEVSINGRWEMYDADLGVYYHDRQGAVAGVEELASCPDLITNPVSPVSTASSTAYSPRVAEIYASTSDNIVTPWSLDDTLSGYTLIFQLPPGGVLELPSLFAPAIRTVFDTTYTSHTNARLTVPRGWSGSLKTPLVIHAIGYAGPHTLSVIGRDSAGRFQAEPTIARWTVVTD